ncbi:MAG TPA: hypothetical protein VES67_07460 [Vicinamibacterales bacterium]|nr:hypothetical protein [Vicinamibacterales bacterium]
MRNLRQTPSAFIAGLVLLSGSTVAAATLTPAALAGWTSYLGSTERRIEREFGATDRFLAQDFGPDAAGKRRALLGGAILVEPVDATDTQGRPIEVPSALVHHWRGAVFIPGARLGDLVTKLQSGAPAARQEDVLQSKVLERQPDRMRVFLRVQRTKFVTVVYDTEHTITFRRHGPARASSASTATKIAEVESPNTPRERELRPGEDRGFLWRWNSYWRYEEGPGGVIAECESVSLSRGVPSVLWYLVGPLIRTTAKESMERTLATMRTRFGQL